MIKPWSAAAFFSLFILLFRSPVSFTGAIKTGSTRPVSDIQNEINYSSEIRHESEFELFQITALGNPQETILLEIQTVPPLEGIQFTLNEERFASDGDGIARIDVQDVGVYQLEVTHANDPESGYQLEFARWGDGIFTPRRELDLSSPTTLEVGFHVNLPVRLDFFDLEGNPVTPSRIASVEIRNSLGDIHTFPGNQTPWIQAGNLLGRDYGLELVDVVQTVQSVMVDGSNVVNRGQQRFVLTQDKVQKIEILLYSAKFTTEDAFFGFPIGRGIFLEYPDGHEEIYDFGQDQTLQLDSLARGTYRVKASGVLGYAPLTVFVLSQPQDVNSIVISVWDFLLILGVGLIIFPGLLFAGRPDLRNRFRKIKIPGLRSRNNTLLLLGFIPIMIAISSTTPAYARDESQEVENPIPMLAYYYIWFDQGSWDRAKKDLPLIGTYSSDDEQVLRQHVQWAKMAGIDGFIVSWKSTDRLNQRLEKLIEIASEEDFKLAIIYQGLDFERRPLPIETIRTDLQHFLDSYAESDVFNLFSKPLLIWSGTWEFSRDEIDNVTGIFREDFFILASERHVDTYLNLADIVDGNAYYWSSVDPERFPGYQEKLDEIGEAVHDHGGLWIAPAAPGFDARLIEGIRVIDRKNGETLTSELEAAFASSPDAVGLISWNEFTENTHVEPSQNYGSRALDVLANFKGLSIPDVLEFDSSDPPGIILEPNLGRLISFGLIGLLVLISLLIILVRGWRLKRGA